MSKLQILEVIADNGPLSSVELAEHLSVSRSYARACVSYCKKRKKIYVLKYVREEVDGHLYPRAVYALGNEPDAKKMRRLSQKQCRDRHRAKKRVRVASVFDLAAPVDTRRLTSRKRPDVSAKVAQNRA